MVTYSSILSFATHGPNADLFSEESKEVLEYSNDEPTMKKRISGSDEEEGDEHTAEIMGTYLSYLLNFLFTLLRCYLLPSFSSFFIYFFICTYMTS